MKIRVELVGQLRDIVGSDKTLVEVEEGSTIHYLLMKMVEKYGRKLEERVFTKITREVSDDVTIVLNGMVIPVEKASSTVLNEADILVLMPEAII
ncbi:MAG: MoaD/ThiS family protein [Thermoproteota archaeon]